MRTAADNFVQGLDVEPIRVQIVLSRAAPFHVLGIDWTDRCNASLIRVSGYYYEVPTLKYAQKL